MEPTTLLYGMVAYSLFSNNTRHKAFRMETNSGIVANIVADECRLVDGDRVVVCLIYGNEVLRGRWSDIKHFREIKAEGS